MARRATAVAVSVLGLTLLAPAGTAWATFGLFATSTASFNVTLDGTDATATYTLPLLVQDTSPSPAVGYHVNIRASSFGDGSGHTLAPGSITTVAIGCFSSCTTAPVNSIAWPVPIGAADVTFFNAANATGVGNWTLTPTISVAVPANARAGTYTTTLTTTLVSGP
jgi:hypothetical protein